MRVWLVMLGRLVEYGLSYPDAEEVLDEYARKHIEWIIKGDMHADWTKISPKLRQDFWKTMKAIASEWIKKNRPGHWARSEFLEQLTR